MEISVGKSRMGKGCRGRKLGEGEEGMGVGLTVALVEGEWRGGWEGILF